MTASLVTGLEWPERAWIAVLALWALCAWLPAWTRAHWLTGLVARETRIPRAMKQRRRSWP